MIAAAGCIALAMVVLLGLQAFAWARRGAAEQTIEKTKRASAEVEQTLQRVPGLPEVLERKLSEIRKHLDEGRAQLQQKLTALALLKAEDSYLETLLREQRVYNDSLLRKLEALALKANVAENSTEAQCTEAEKACADAKARLKEIEASLASHKEKLESLNAAIAEAKGKSEEFKTKLASVQKSYFERRAEQGALSKEINDLDAAYTKLKPECNDLEHREEQLRESIAALKRELDKK